MRILWGERVMEPQAIIDNFRRVVTGHYVDFEGRTGRKEFWYYILAYVILYIAVRIVESIISLHVFTQILSIALLLPNLGIGVRRLHDTDRSGWWILIGVVPAFILGVLSAMALMAGGLGAMLVITSIFSFVVLAAAALLIYWYAQPGTAGSNRFGAEPGVIPAAATS
jgi:uncharacterized membrane protein YhaH (DUF805 family)